MVAERRHKAKINRSKETKQRINGYFSDANQRKSHSHANDACGNCEDCEDCESDEDFVYVGGRSIEERCHMELTAAGLLPHSPHFQGSSHGEDWFVEELRQYIFGEDNQVSDAIRKTVSHHLTLVCMQLTLHVVPNAVHL